MPSQIEVPLISARQLKDVAELMKPHSVLDFFVLFFSLWAASLWLTRGIWWDTPDLHSSIFYERPQLKDAAAGAFQGQTRDVLKRLDELGKTIVVFWGSQSGTAERFAQKFSRDLKLKLDLESLVADLSDYDAQSIARLTEQHLAVFFISTYGEGDPSDNASGLWDWLKSMDKQSETLSELRYLAFGLGNSTYLHYNRAIDVVDQKLKLAGAQCLVEPGKADDAVGATAEDFFKWRDSTISRLSRHFGVEIMNRPAEPTFAIVQDPFMDLQDLYVGEHQLPERIAGYSPIASLPIRASRELFADTLTRNCLHLEVDLANQTQIAYKTGDHFGLWVSNTDEEVESLIDTLGLDEQRHIPIVIKAKEEGVKVNLPSPTTVNALLKHYLEICAPVSRDTVQSLKTFAPCADSATWLDKLSKDPELFSAYLTENHITLGKVLRLASQAGGKKLVWTKLGIANVIDLVPRLQPRYYSISSSSVVTPRIAHLTVLVAPQALLRSKSQTIPGLASNHLLQMMSKGIHPDSQSTNQKPVPHVVGFVRKSKFKLPVAAACPLIMIAAGTGLAPFRAFIQERARIKDSGREIGEMMLFFGCQHPERDFIYAEELSDFENRIGGDLTIIKSFSRLDPSKKDYVQHRVKNHGERVMSMIRKGANLYVCGRTSMARDVATCMRELAGKLLEKSSSETEAWVDTLKKARKWQEDVWG